MFGNKDDKKPSSPDETPGVGVDPKLIQLLLEERAETAKEKQAERDQRRRKDAARSASAEDLEAAERTRVQACGHLKGGRNRAYNAKTDFALTSHTFIDSVTRIRCSLCGFSVYGPRKGGQVPADTREIVYRDRGNGYESLQNPTYNPAKNKPGISYADATEMLKQTTNTPSHSERVLDNPAAKVAETNTKLTAAEAEIEKLKAQLKAAKQ